MWFIAVIPLQVQVKVNNKYDVWHKDIVGRFGSLLGQNMQDFYTVIGKVREGRELYTCNMYNNDSTH